MKPVLCVRNDRDDTLGIVLAAFAEADIPTRRLDAFANGIAWPDVEHLGGLVVFGGEMNVDDTERYPFLLAQRHLIQRAVDAGVPVLGICLGAQLLARAFDARVSRAPVRELGFRPVTITAAGRDDELLRAFASGDRVFQWHEDTVELPNDAALLATGDDGAVQAYRIGRQAWGIQFHFEVDRQGIEAWLAASGSTLERVWHVGADQVRAELATYLDGQQQRARGLLKAYARVVTEAQGVSERS